MSGDKKPEGEKLIASNPIARSNYFIDETVEAGIVLTGTEVKSLRTQTPNIRDGYVEVSGRGTAVQAWLTNVHIGPYSHGNIYNHEALRRRKLLLHRRQIDKIFGEITQNGISVIPLRIYFLKGKVKVELGLGKGKKKYDKREDLKKKSAKEEMDAVVKYGRKP